MECNCFSNFITWHYRNIYVNCFSEIQSSEEMTFKSLFLVLTLVSILFSGVEPFSNFGTGPCKEHFCELILNLSHSLVTRCLSINDFFFIFNSVGLVILWSRTHYSNFGAGPFEKLFCNFLASIHRLERSSHFFFLLFLALIAIFSVE